MATPVQLAAKPSDPLANRSVGSFLLALQAGLAAQWLLDPQCAPSASQLVGALRALATIVAPADRGPCEAPGHARAT